MLLVFKQLFILYIFLFAGWLIGKLKKDKASHADILSVLLVNLLLPCKVFNTFANNFTVSYFKEGERKTQRGRWQILFYLTLNQSSEWDFILFQVFWIRGKEK